MKVLHCAATVRYVHTKSDTAYEVFRAEAYEVLFETLCAPNNSRAEDILMERTGAVVAPERLKSFDLLASVDMLRFDLERYGRVLPETRQRVYDEELSSIAEGAERASRTEFVLAKEGDGLVYFDRGDWRSYTAMLITGNKVAHHEAQVDYRKQFLADWSDRDLAIGYQLRSLMPGQALSWTNSYPHQIEQQYGAEFLVQCGLIPSRKMGFIYRAQCFDDGSIVLQSQTVDQSDKEAFSAVEETYMNDHNASMDTLLHSYDRTLVDKTGAYHYAGRQDAERLENAWEDIIQQHDLIEYFLDGLESLATETVPRAVLEKKVEKHVIGVWKAFKLRMNARNNPLKPQQKSMAMTPQAVLFEVQQAYYQAQAEGDIKIGCGGAIGGAQDEKFSVDGQATFNAIFGKPEDSHDKSKWKWRQGTCRVESCPTRPGKTKVGPCDVCVRCQAKFDAGKDPTKNMVFSAESPVDTPKFDAVEAILKMLRKDDMPKDGARNLFTLAA